MMALAMPDPIASAAAPRPGRARPAEPELDRATLERCKAHDPLAFRRFIARYERTVFAVLGRILCRQDVEDLAQEAFLRAYRAFPSFELDHASRPSTWIVTIAVRLALNERSKQRPRSALPLEAVSEPASTVTPETERVRAELGQAIAEAAATLPDDQRAAFVLAELHDLSTAEIARALDVPESTAKTRLFRAREKLRELLAGWMGRKPEEKS